MDEYWEYYLPWLYCWGAFLGIAFIVFLVNIRRPADALAKSALWIARCIAGWTWVLVGLAIGAIVLGVGTITHHGGVGRVALAGAIAVVCGGLSAIVYGIKAHVQGSAGNALVVVCLLAALAGLVLLGIALVMGILALAG